MLNILREICFHNPEMFKKCMAWWQEFQYIQLIQKLYNVRLSKYCLTYHAQIILKIMLLWPFHFQSMKTIYLSVASLVLYANRVANIRYITNFINHCLCAVADFRSLTDPLYASLVHTSDITT